MQIITLVKTNIENSILFNDFMERFTALTAEAFFKFFSGLGVEGLTQDAISPNADTNPEKWREALNRAPQNLLQVHNEVWARKPELLNDIVKLDTKYVVGLIEAEGCFSVYPVGRELKIMEEFTLALHSIDDQLVRSLRAFFGVGRIIQKEDKSIYTVNASWQLHYVIVPFIEQHSLIGLKRRDFIILKEVVFIKTETILLRSSRTRNLTKYWIIMIVYMFSEISSRKKRKSKFFPSVKEGKNLRVLTKKFS